MEKEIEIHKLSENKFTKIKETTAQIKEHIAQVLLIKKKSWVTKASEIWNKLSLWQKILLGMLLGASLLIPGVVAKIAALITAGAIGVAAYGGIGVVLQQHLKVEEEANENITNIIAPLTNALESIINDLNQIQENFNSQLDNLKQNIQNLNNENETLSETAKKFGALLVTKEELENEVQQLKRINETLHNTVGEISGVIIEDQAQHKEFINRLNTFLSDKNATFDQITKRICEAEKELEIVNKELEKNNQRYTNLLNNHEKLIQRQENLSNLQSQTGIFAANNKSFEEEEGKVEFLRP